jgi:hypothetical protein
MGCGGEEREDSDEGLKRSDFSELTGRYRRSRTDHLLLATRYTRQPIPIVHPPVHRPPVQIAYLGVIKRRLGLPDSGRALAHCFKVKLSIDIAPSYHSKQADVMAQHTSSNRTAGFLSTWAGLSVDPYRRRGQRWTIGRYGCLSHV